MISAGVRRRLWPACLAILVAAGGAQFPDGVTLGALATPDDAAWHDWVFVTDDTAVMRSEPYAPGCDAISAFDIRSGEALFKGLTSVSPNRLAAAQDFSVVVAGPSGSWGPEWGHLYVVRPTFDGPWELMPWVGGTSFAPAGAVAVLPDGDTVLVSTARKPPGIGLGMPVAPFGIEAYRLSEIRGSGYVEVPPERYEAWRLGRRHGRMELPGLPAQILKAPDSDLMHVITESADWIISTFDPDRLEEVAPQIRLERLSESIPSAPYQTTGWISGSLSDDGRYLVTGRGLLDNRLNIADLEERRAWTVDIGQESNGTAFNRGWINKGLLAIGHQGFVGIYRWEPPDTFTEVGRVPARPPWSMIPRGTIAWSTSGRELIAAEFANPRDDGLYDFSVFTISDGGASASLLHHLEPCSSPYGNSPLDILTANGLVTPTATSTPSPTTDPTATPTLTASPTATSPTPSPTEVTPSPTAAPRRIYLPIATSGHCLRTVTADIVLVLDTSSSMLDLVAPGRRKIDAAVAAATRFLEQLSPGDQAAIVSFNASASVVGELTSDVPALVRALSGLETAEFTRIDLGIRAARDELLSERRRAANRPVMIVLSDGRSNPVPVEMAEAEASLAKSAGITLFTIGFGAPEDLDRDALGRMASRPEHYYDAPSADDLAEIYAAIGDLIPCLAR